MKNGTDRTLPKWTKGNRLVGWFVSYTNDSDGVVYEIREGRRFLGNSPLDGSNTIVLDESTIGAPHAVMAASKDHAVYLQDIFSDHGTFLQRNDDDEERRIDGPVVLQHGDKLRFGKTLRFQVCLIDGPGNRN